jgi:epoxyqueuosine reductase
MQSKEHYSALIKTEAKRLGFLACGIAEAGFLEKEAPRLEKWLKENNHGEMKYMENHFDKRLDPRLLVDDAKSVISLLYNYYPEEKQSESSFKVSKYAYGEDYHYVMKDKLKALLFFIHENIGDVNGRAFVDSAPVMDKAWAVKSGIGWLGKNANVLTKKVGSFYFIGELIVDLKLAYDSPTTDHCGQCTACIDSCPTEAIIAPYIIDSKKCISYATIELKNEIPDYFKDKMDDWIYGCDVCQDVCPWNKFSKTHNEPLFEANKPWIKYSKKEWTEITEEVFKIQFKKSAVQRTKFNGLKRNIEFVTKKKNP